MELEDEDEDGEAEALAILEENATDEDRDVAAKAQAWLNGYEAEVRGADGQGRVPTGYGSGNLPVIWARTCRLLLLGSSGEMDVMVGTDNFQLKMRNMKYNLEQLSHALRRVGGVQSSRETMALAALLQGKESKENVQAIFGYLDAQIEKLPLLPMPSSFLLEPSLKSPTAYQAKLGKAEEKIKEQANQLKDQAIAMEEMNRQLTSFNGLNLGQLGAHKNRPLPQHAQVPGSSSWKPTGIAPPPPPASASAPPSAPLRIPAPPAATKAFNLKQRLGKLKK